MSQQGRTRSGSVVFPLLLIAIGVMFLLWRWLPDFDPFPVLWKYWPLFLILVGAGMIWDSVQRHRDPQTAPAFPIGSMLGTLSFLALLATLLWSYHHSHRRAWTNWDVVSTGHNAHSQKTVNLQGAKAVRVHLEMPAGELRFEGGAQQLLEAEFWHSETWGDTEVDYNVENGVGSLEIMQEKGGQLVGRSENIWSLKVNDTIPLDLNVDVGAGKGDFHLAKVNLTGLELNIGAGQATVDLTGERGKDLQAEIHGGVGEAIVRLPKNIGVVATVHGGLGSVDVRGLKEEDGQYINAAYGKSPNTIRLTVEGGIGHIRLEQE